MSRADILKKAQDLSYLSWTESAHPSGMGGARPKAREGIGPDAVYYKSFGLCSQDAAAPLICCRLMDMLGIEHVPFQLVNARLCSGAHVWVAKTRSYRRNKERAISLEDFWELSSKVSETPLELCARMGWVKQVAECMLVDYLTATRDRDESCFEVICDAKGSYRLSPIQPRSMCLANAFPHGLWKKDPLADLGTSNYVGASSLDENLAFAVTVLGCTKKPEGLKRKLLANLDDIVEEDFLTAAATIVEERWEHYARLCNL